MRTHQLIFVVTVFNEFMPNLTTLSMKNCYNLKTDPGHFFHLFTFSLYTKYNTITSIDVSGNTYINPGDIMRVLYFMNSSLLKLNIQNNQSHFIENIYTKEYFKAEMSKLMMHNINNVLQLA
jgi:hypothetical protein